MSSFEPLLDAPAGLRRRGSARDDDFLRPALQEADRVDVGGARQERAKQAGSDFGSQMGAYRQALAGIRQRRFGGFLNYNNWGWVRRRRENRLRQRFAGLFGQGAAPRQGEGGPPPVLAPQGIPQQVPPQQVPPQQVPPQASAQGLLQEPPSLSAMEEEIKGPMLHGPTDTRTALPRRSALKPGGVSLVRTPQNGSTTLARAEKEQAELFEREAQASMPFGPGGQYFGRLDATRRNQQAGPPSTILGLPGPVESMSLFGAVEPSVDPQAEQSVRDYAAAMDATSTHESRARSLAGYQNRKDQGDLLSPQPDPDDPRLRHVRAPYFSALWRREIESPTPFARSANPHTVRFDGSAEQEPEEGRDPGRAFAQVQAKHAASKAKRVAKVQDRITRDQKKHPDLWADARSVGAEAHRKWQEDPRVTGGRLRPQGLAVPQFDPIEEDKHEEARVDDLASDSDGAGSPQNPAAEQLQALLHQQMVQHYRDDD